MVSLLLTDIGLGEMPGTGLLAGVREFQPSQAPTDEAQGCIAQLMSQLKEKSGLSKSPPPAMTATGEGLPALPRKWVEKIQAGEYIDFAELPPAKGKIKTLPSSIEGQILVIQAADWAESRKIIPDFATWVQCFSVYMAVVTAKDPDRTKNLLAYLSLIAKCSLKYRWPSWVVYDQNFRQEAAESGLRDWSKVDPSIYAQCFTGASISPENWCKRCHSVDHASEGCPLKPSTANRRPPPPAAPPSRKRPPPRSNPEPCKRFNNYDGDCKFGDSCIYQHKCDNCGELSHPATKCSKPKRSSG